MNRNIYSPGFCVHALLVAILVFCSSAHGVVNAQCNNWHISAQLVSASTCAANAVVQVSVSGADAVNLSNIKYGIPVSGNGFSMPLNNNANLTGIPPGSYVVSAVAECNGMLVGKNNNVVVPGHYVAPVLNATVIRESVGCGAFGIIRAEIINGRSPFTIHINNAPAAYTGPLTFTVPAPTYYIPGLPQGNYTIQVTDACGNGTAPQNMYVSNLPLTSLSFQIPQPSSAACDSISVPHPYIPGSSPWGGYNDDTLFRFSVQIAGLLPPTPFELMTGIVNVKLPPGSSIADCYGKTMKKRQCRCKLCTTIRRKTYSFT